MNIKQLLRDTLKDRTFVLLWFALLVLAGVVIVAGVLTIRPSDLQVPTRYSAFGITNFYRDKWYYALAFVFFAIFVAVMHILVSLKLYAAKGRRLAVAFLWMSLIVMALAVATIFVILRLISFGQ